MKLRLGLTMLALAVVGTGCGRHYEAHEVANIRAAAGGTLNASTLMVRVPEGAVLTAELTPFDNEDEPMESPEIAADDPDTLEVMRVSGGTEVHYAFIGRRVGETTVRFFAEGREVRRERGVVTER